MHILETYSISEEEALKKAIDFLETDADSITAKLQKKGNSKFLGFGQSQPNLYCIFPTEKATKEVIIRGILKLLLSKMGYQDSKVAKIEKQDNNKLYVEIDSPWTGHIIGKKGNTIDSLQTILNILLDKHFKESYRIILDIESYREKKKNKLEELALKLAKQVKDARKSKLLYPLNPYERRIIHMTLQDDENISTESEGEGLYKKIRIKYLGEPKSYDDEKNNSYPDNKRDDVYNDKKSDSVVIDDDDSIPDHITNEIPSVE